MMRKHDVLFIHENNSFNNVEFKNIHTLLSNWEGGKKLVLYFFSL